MEQHAALGHAELRGQHPRGALALQPEQRTAVAVAARADLLGNAADLYHGGLVALRRHEGAGALAPHQHLLRLQLVERAVHGHARDAELGGEPQFGRDGVPLAPGAGLDFPLHIVLDALEGGRRRGRRGGR
ncbi:hypothetical protein D3C85_1558530 [compost metagenome]